MINFILGFICGLGSMTIITIGIGRYFTHKGVVKADEDFFRKKLNPATGQ